MQENTTMQTSVSKFIEQYGLHSGPAVRYIDLVSEVGELGKELLKGSDYGKNAFTVDEHGTEEMGDCLFSLLALCCELHIDANEALAAALQKYEARFSAKGNIGSGR